MALREFEQDLHGKCPRAMEPKAIVRQGRQNNRRSRSHVATWECMGELCPGDG